MCGGIPLLPTQAGMRGWACVPGFTCWSPLLAWLSLCFCPSAARNILGPVSRSPVRLLLLVLVWFVFCFCFFRFVFLFLCLCVGVCCSLLGCVWFPSCVLLFILSAFVSLHTILPFRGGGGLVALVAACMYGHTFRSLCVRRVGVGIITRLLVLVGAAIVLFYLAAAYTREYWRHTLCSLCKLACGAGHNFPATPLGHLCWCGYRCALSVA